MATVHIFISYRRDADAARAALVHHSIEGAFSDASSEVSATIFRDVRQRLGVDWSAGIQEELARSDLVVAVIGPDWLSARDKYFMRRIDQQGDWVRREIEMALEQNKTIIPLLFDDTPMPPVEALPDSLASLAGRQGLPVRTAQFDDDVQPLLREIMEHGARLGDALYSRVKSDYSDTRWPYPNPPLVVKPAEMSDEDIATARREIIPEWSVAESAFPQDEEKMRVELSRELRFRSFADALTFMSEVGVFCDQINHHPRWENIFKTVYIHLSTWDIGHRVSHIDLILAAHIDKAFALYQKR